MNPLEILGGLVSIREMLSKQNNSEKLIKLLDPQIESIIAMVADLEEDTDANSKRT